MIVSELFNKLVNLINKAGAKPTDVVKLRKPDGSLVDVSVTPVNDTLVVSEFVDGSPEAVAVISEPVAPPIGAPVAEAPAPVEVAPVVPAEEAPVV